ncbi:unnamed protein product [Leptidea sinapis]|uniref:Uncharacterized protein n=1 Tax=Leptidea sinapis TaxID=189913 RepID=A0A5E4PNM8_9NEOP|nr:unnamed protein product [Leptidea sinapis]
MHFPRYDLCMAFLIIYDIASSDAAVDAMCVLKDNFLSKIIPRPLMLSTSSNDRLLKEYESLFPRFVEPVTNVTVAWVRVDTQTILSIHHNIITQNPRISLSYNDHRSWYLHIKNVQEVDRGWNKRLQCK